MLALSVVAGVLAFAVAAALAALARWLVPRLGLLDTPRQDRWHRRPVPKFGGVAIFVAFLVASLVFAPRPFEREVIGVLLGSAAIFVVGLVDDLRRLENRTKLLLLILTACIPAVFGVGFGTFPAVVGIPLGIIWILGATNALNWLDNMDGVAGGVAAIAAAMLLVLATTNASPAPGLLAAALLGASLGFLIHNFPPARIFMGDAGSGFLGFALAATATLGSAAQVSNVLLTVLTPGLILAVPIFDTLTVAVLRRAHGRSIFQGGRDHPSHRLVAWGLSERRAVLLLYVLAALSGGVGLLARRLGLLPGLAVSVILGLGFVALGVVLAEVRPYAADGSPPDAARWPGRVTNARWLASMGLDFALLCVAFVTAQLLRFEGQIPAAIEWRIAVALPVVAATKMAALYALGTYRGSWRYAGIVDLIRLLEAASVGTLAAATVLFAWTRFEGLSRAALILDWLLTMGLLTSARIAVRAVREYLAAHRESGRRVLIAGVGSAGAALARTLREMPELGYRPLGFVDGNGGATRGAVIQGLRVLGCVEDLPVLLVRHRVQAVILVPPDLNGDDATTRALCERAGVQVLQTGNLIE